MTQVNGFYCHIPRTKYIIFFTSKDQTCFIEVFSEQITDQKDNPTLLCITKPCNNVHHKYSQYKIVHILTAQNIHVQCVPITFPDTVFLHRTVPFNKTNTSMKN